MYGCGKDSLILVPFRLPQISCFTLSLKCFSSDSDNGPDVEIRPLLQFLHLSRAGPVLSTLLFFPLVPSSYWVLRGSIYSFLWSGTPVFSQLVFCMHFCVWRCIPNVFLERDVRHIHLLVCHLVLLLFWYWVVWAACTFWKLILCQLFPLLLFSPILRIVFSLCSFLCCAKAFKFN